MATENANTQNAATLGMGFHQFDGNINVNEVIKEIGADFTVREDRLVRVPEDVMEAIKRGEPVTINPNYIIGTHKATVHDGLDQTIGIVGADYGVIQNQSAFDILDMMCNASVTENPLKIVSAGLVGSKFEPYMQAILPTTARVDGDKSDTVFYVFAHTTHDGTSGLQIRFSPVRVICRNTFMANVNSRLGMTFKHSKYVGERIDLTNGENVKRVQQIVAKLGILQQEYIDKMNSFAKIKLTEKEIEEFTMNMFIDDEETKRNIRLNNYSFENVDGVKTRTLNLVNSFKNTLYSDEGGQDFASGTKLWLFNGTTNYLSNKASYGSAKDTDGVRAEKRFNAMLDGSANKKMEKAMELLAA